MWRLWRRGWIKIFFPHSTGHVITYLCWDLSYAMLVKENAVVVWWVMCLVLKHWQTTVILGLVWIWNHHSASKPNSQCPKWIIWCTQTAAHCTQFSTHVINKHSISEKIWYSLISKNVSLFVVIKMHCIPYYNAYRIYYVLGYFSAH